jgi:hypothetical protein
MFGVTRYHNSQSCLHYIAIDTYRYIHYANSDNHYHMYCQCYINSGERQYVQVYNVVFLLRYVYIALICL